MIKLNCLAKDLENAKEIYKATNENALIGILTKSFESEEECIEKINKWSTELNGDVSIGLGGGDPKQGYMVSRVAHKVNANHANQVFPLVASTKIFSKNKNIIVNALVSPSGTPGQVIVSTGPLSSNLEKKVVISSDAAAVMIKEMNGDSIKFFNMSNMKSIDEYREVAKSCVKHDLILEPTGGLGLDNIEELLKIAKEEGVKKIIPHLYSSIIDKTTGKTDITKVTKVFNIFKKYY